MARDQFSALSAFLMVAEERSFTKAAKRLGVSPSALSHAIRGLEEEVGVRLLARTTRSVATTDAGEQLIASLRPALADIRATLSLISGLRIQRLRPRTTSRATAASTSVTDPTACIAGSSTRAASR